MPPVPPPPPPPPPLLLLLLALQLDPDSKAITSFDWWTKYYYSIGDEAHTEPDQMYRAKGHDKLVVG